MRVLLALVALCTLLVAITEGRKNGDSYSFHSGNHQYQVKIRGDASTEDISLLLKAIKSMCFISIS